MSRRMGNNDFKPQMDGTGGPQPKKRRKNANAANANAVNNTASKFRGKIWLQPSISEMKTGV